MKHGHCLFRVFIAFRCYDGSYSVMCEVTVTNRQTLGLTKREQMIDLEWDGK